MAEPRRGSLAETLAWLCVLLAAVWAATCVVIYLLSTDTEAHQQLVAWLAIGGPLLTAACILFLVSRLQSR